MLPSPPPPPEAPTAPSAAAPTARPLFQNPPRPPNPIPFYSPTPPRLPSNPNPNYPQLAHLPPDPPHPHSQDPAPLLYPVASSGRGFISRPVCMPSSRPSQRPPFGFPYLDQNLGNPGFVRPNNLPQANIGYGQGSSGNVSGAVIMTGLVKPIHVPDSQQPKVVPASTTLSDNNGHKELRTRDDALTTIRDRKARVSDNSSLYALCRSWLKNGFPEDTQLQSLDAVTSLPRPVPLAGEFTDSPDKMAGGKGQQSEDQESCEQLSEKELLQRHIRRAKRIRSRLKEQRFQRIERYKSRLVLLLPPTIEKHIKNESAAAN